MADPIVAFHHQYTWFLTLFMSGVFPAIVATLFWGENFWYGVLFSYTRHIVSQHLTQMVNRVIHTFGDQPYSTDNDSRENLWVSILAVGEGYHNWHHKYPFDYASSELDIREGAVNLSKIFIDFWALLGQVSERYDHHHH